MKVKAIINKSGSGSVNVRIPLPANIAKELNINSNKGLWLRNNISTLTSQFLDTLIFTLIAFAGTVSFEELVILIFTTYVLKAVVAVLDTPVLYMAKKMKK